MKIEVVSMIGSVEHRFPATLVKVTPDSTGWELLFEKQNYPHLRWDGVYKRADSGLAAEALTTGVYDARPQCLDLSELVPSHRVEAREMKSKRFAIEWLWFVGALITGLTIVPLVILPVIGAMMPHSSFNIVRFYRSLLLVGKDPALAWIVVLAPYVGTQAVRSVVWAIQTVKSQKAAEPGELCSPGAKRSGEHDSC